MGSGERVRVTTMATTYVDANAYNLLDHAQNSNDPLIKETALVMIEASSIFTDIPTVTRKSFKMNGTRITGDLADPSWVNIDEPPAIVKDPDPEPWEEGIFIHRDGCQVDDLYLQEENVINDPFELKIKTKIRGFTYSLNDALINNVHLNYANRNRAVNKKCFVGLRERLDKPELYYTNTNCKIDGGGVDLSSGGAASDGIQMEYLLEQALAEIGAPDGTGVAIVASSKWRRSFNRSIKKAGSGGGFRYDKDALDRTVEMFMNAKVIDCGRKAPTGSKMARTQTSIISNTETSDGTADTGSQYTSVYLIKYGMEHLYKWEFAPFKPSEPYLLPDGTTWQVNLNGTCGIAIPDTRAFARIYDIKVDTGG